MIAVRIGRLLQCDLSVGPRPRCSGTTLPLAIEIREAVYAAMLRAFSRLSAVGWIRAALGQHTPDRVAHDVRFIQRDVVAAALGDDYAAVLETRDELALMQVPVVLQLITQRARQYVPSVAHDDDRQTGIPG